MQTVTGREVVLSMLELTTEIAHWNKKCTTKEALLQMLEEFGLTLHQAEILGFLHGNPECNTISAISEELLISKGSLSLMISKLQSGGFVRKKSAVGEDDGRKVYISLTKKGVDAVEQFKGMVVANASEAFDTMDEKMRTLFYTKVKELKELFNTGGWKE